MPKNINLMFHEKFINAHPSPLWIVKADDVTFCSINSAAEKEFLYRENELLEQSLLKLCPSFSINEFHTITYAKGEKKIITKIRRKDNREEAAELVISKFTLENENYFYILIKPLVQTNIYSNTKELTDFFYYYALRMHPVPVIIVEETSLKIVHVNEGAVKLYGYTRDEIMGNKITFLNHPSEILHAQRMLDAIKEKKYNTFELKQVSKSHRIIETEIFVQTIRSFEANLLIFVLHDISAKKTALRLMEENVDNYQIIINNSTDLILRFNTEGKVRYASPSSLKLLGYKPGFLTENNLYNFIHTEDIEKFKNGVLSVTESNQFKTRLRIKSSAEKYLWFETIIKLHPDYNNIFEKKLISISWNISEKVEIENKLDEATEKAKEIEKLKRIIMSNISHEMRTPLQSIIGYSNNIKEKVFNPELIEDIDIICENSQRLLRMINLFLNLTYLESNNFLPYFEVNNLIDIVTNAAGPYMNTAKRKNLSFKMSSESQPIYVNTDKIILKDILENLIDNAIKFTHEGSIKIFVSTKKLDNIDYAVIIIEDSGIGIPHGKEDLVLQEFRQLSEGLTRNYEGIGMGLSIAKRLIEKLNGKMVINSSSGIGTVIRIYLTKEELI